MQTAVKARYSELDWARVILVFAVFLHHVGMPFNGDGFVVMNADSSKLLDDIMVYFEQFRLPTLFMIAGAGAALLLTKKAAGAFVMDKVRRLLLPLVVGVLFIIPPQLYYGDPAAHVSFLAAFPSLALRLETMHLWFIEFLFVFALLAVPVSALLKTQTGQSFLKKFQALVVHPTGFAVLAVVLVLIRVGLKQAFPDEDKAIENLSLSGFHFFFFLSGFLLARHPASWAQLGRQCGVNTAIFIGLSVIFYIYYFVDMSGTASARVLWAIWWGIGAAVAWYGALAILGLLQRFVHNTPAWLMKTNEVIYPFYILHQTVIVVLAFYIVQWQAGIGVKLAALLVSALIVTAALSFLVIRRVNILRVLFGLKAKQLDQSGKDLKSAA